MSDWLIDKSALVRLAHAIDAGDWLDRCRRGLVRIAIPTLLETGYSARSAEDWESLIGGPPISWFPIEHLTPSMERRAVEVQGILAARGQHRAPSIPDLLLAAVAERSGLVVLHLDKDFELIAEVTGQPTERLQVAPQSRTQR
ncbi:MULTISPECIES: PIN domain nuclease [unclassified Nocardioides]|uniref:PIN domain nuclease n=1 Tax=unclassified Nocardioides TaxID=2615069 RepID=UPI0007024B58|nr:MULTISPECIES: PIN domain nuclease [unclassified Nocardioides]KRC53552.1 ribonuclease [Nocardioides sp. Root79]KRC67972.1 ribonuclease [Nocardioides sp. Root240]